MVMAFIIYCSYLDSRSHVKKVEAIVREAIEIYPEIQTMIDIHPWVYDKLIQEYDTFLPNLIDTIIEHRLSN